MSEVASQLSVKKEEIKILGHPILLGDVLEKIKNDESGTVDGWNSMGLGINRGFRMDRILLVPHGGSKNDTIVTVETKL